MSHIGRPVRVVSLCFPIGSLPRENVAARVDQEGSQGSDLLVLPETWPGQEAEALDGPTLRLLRPLARRHRTYLVCPIYRLEGGLRYNSAVLLDRDGEIACIYDKVYPYWSEFDSSTAIGSEIPVHTADFGRIGMATCFDVNFPEVWQRLAAQGAELVVWPSAYSAGTQLQAHALNHHFSIVTATATRDCQVYDITGQRLLDERSDGDIHVSRITLDLDRGLYHENFNVEKRHRLLEEQGNKVTVDMALPREQWFVLKAIRPGVSARALAREYGLEELRDYKTRSRCEIDRMRGRTLGSAA